MCKNKDTNSKNGGQESETFDTVLLKDEKDQNFTNWYNNQIKMNNETAAQLLQVLEKTISPGKSIIKVNQGRFRRNRFHQSHSFY